jgi:DNA-binding protein YbaB
MPSIEDIMKMAQEAQTKLMEEQAKLEKIIAAALNDARNKAEAAGAESMSQAMGGMALPPGFKMPF